MTYLSYLLSPFTLRLTLPQLPNKYLHNPFPLPFRPILKPGTHANSQEPPVRTEAQGRHTSRILLILPYPPLSDAIPQRHDPIPASTRKRPMHRMERQRVDRVHDIYTVRRRLAVTFERVFTCLRRGRGIEPLDRDAALDARAGVAGVVGHAGDGARHELQTALAALPGLSCDGVGRRLRGLGGEDGERFEVVDMQGARGHGDDELGGRQGEREGFARQRDRGGEVGGLGGVVDVQG